LQFGIFPKLLIVEYNAKFPPPIKWKIRYDERHSWDGTDYFGASLQSLAELLAGFSYTLVCCNAATGANAFRTSLRTHIFHISLTYPKELKIFLWVVDISFINNGATDHQLELLSKCFWPHEGVRRSLPPRRALGRT
jgi:hypothetical protein